jgi:hypothetical protein
MVLIDFDSQPELHADPYVEQTERSEIHGFWTSRQFLTDNDQTFSGRSFRESFSKTGRLSSDNSLCFFSVLLPVPFDPSLLAIGKVARIFVKPFP